MLILDYILNYIPPTCVYKLYHYVQKSPKTSPQKYQSYSVYPWSKLQLSMEKQPSEEKETYTIIFSLGNPPCLSSISLRGLQSNLL